MRFWSIVDSPKRDIKWRIKLACQLIEKGDSFYICSPDTLLFMMGLIPGMLIGKAWRHVGNVEI